jgi:hypothetical protein
LDRRVTGLILVVIGIIGVIAFPLYVGPIRNSPAYGSTSTWNPGTTGQWPWTKESRITFDEAVTRFQDYIASTGNKDLALREVMEFESNFYAIVYEKSTGIGAFELLIDKPSERGVGAMGGMMHGQGLVYPEPGPNMMWNTKCDMMTISGMMGSGRGFVSKNPNASSDMPITPEQAQAYAMKYLTQNFAGASLEKPDRFYGYYTIHILKDGKIGGMLSVNGYTGDVWYHGWHGYFIQEKDFS